MILVTLGTQKQQFTRLLDYIEKSKIKDEIIVQAGYTKYKSKKMKIIDFVDYDDMAKYIDRADLVITHGGTGSILSAIKKGKKVIACSRLEKYGEHVDDHQEQIVDVLSQNGYILKLDEKVKIDELYKNIKNFKPKKFESNGETFRKKLIECIENKNKNRFDILFSIIFIMLLFIIPLLVFLRPAKKTSVFENRTLAQLNGFSYQKFKKGEFQDNIEDYLEDQMVLGTTMKKVNNRMKSLSRKALVNTIFRKNKIVPLEKGYCLLNGSDGKKYIIYCPKTITSFKKPLEDNIKILNMINDRYKDSGITIKSFRITTDEEFNVSKEIDDIFNNNYIGEYISLDLLHSYEDVEKYFFRSDHHWNYLGSYEGYKQIMEFLDKDYLEPIDEVCFKDTSFKGSLASQTGEDNITDSFCVHKFNYPDYEIQVFGPDEKLGYSEDYFNGIYPTGKYNNHYRKFYGGGFGEVIIDNKDNKSEDNILLLVDSMTDATARLIASSYDHTYVVDLRRYKTYTNKSFDLDSYVQENNIKTILFCGNIRFFVTNEFLEKLK